MSWLDTLIMPFVADIAEWVAGSRFARLIAWGIALALLAGAVWLLGRFMGWW